MPGRFEILLTAQNPAGFEHSQEGPSSESEHFAQAEDSGAIPERSDARHFRIRKLLHENKEDISSPL